MNSIRWMICCWAALGVVVNSPLRAQDLEPADIHQVGPAHDHDHDHEHALVPDHHQHIRERQEASFKRHLALRITELKHVCKLEEKQIKKLEIASKGAVEEAMKLFLQRFPQLKAPVQQPVQQPLPQLGAAQDFAVPARPEPARPALALAIARPIRRAIAQLRVTVDQADGAEAQVDTGPLQDEPADLPAPALEAPAPLPDLAPVEVFVAPQFAPAAAPAIWNAHQNFRMEPSEAASTVVWRNTVKRVLTDEQMASYRAAQTKRRLFKRQTIADRVVASVDRRLFLSDQQRQALGKVILDTLGDNLDNMVPQGGFTSDAMVAAQVVGQIPKEKLDGVLDAAQIESWNDLQQVQHGVVFGGALR